MTNPTNRDWLSDISYLRMLGREAEAQRLLDAYNQVQRAFGAPEAAMPPPDDPRLYMCGGVIADARKVTPSEFLRGVGR